MRFHIKKKKKQSVVHLLQLKLPGETSPVELWVGSKEVGGEKRLGC